VTVHLTKDGVVDAFEVKGGLTLTVTNEAAVACQVQLADKAFPAGRPFDFPMFDHCPHVEINNYYNCCCYQFQLMIAKDNTSPDAMIELTLQV